jgi:hypothetical protein
MLPEATVTLFVTVVLLAGGACAAAVSTHGDPQKTAKTAVISNATKRATHAHRALLKE